MNLKHAVFIFIFCALLSSFFIYKAKNISFATGKITINAPSPTPTPYFTNYALLGYGGGGHEGGALTDTMIVAHVDDKQKKVFLVSVPRDTYVNLKIQNKVTDGFKINEAYAAGLDDATYPNKLDQFKNKPNGGVNVAKLALQNVIGQQIKNVFVINFELFRNFIDTINGVTIYRDAEFVDRWYPIEAKTKDSCGKTDDEIKELTATLSAQLLEHEFTCRYETLRLLPGNNNLDGEAALKYARSRHSDVEGGDFYRSEHQKQIILAVKQKLSNIYNLAKVVGLAKSFLKYVDTDAKSSEAVALVTEIFNKRDYKIVNVGISTSNVMREGIGPYNAYILKPASDDFANINKFLQEAFTTRNYASTEAKFQKIK